MSNSTRRLFMTKGLGVVGLSAVAPKFLAQTALAAKAEADQRALVVIQLSGGNDGLATIVPHGHDEYHEVRKATRFTPDEVIKIDKQVGFHPNLGPFKKLLDEGSLAVVQGVGYPNPNQSHFTSMDIWHLADPTARTNSTSTDTSIGWLGRYLDTNYSKNPDAKRSLAVGSGQAPRALKGKLHPGLSFQVPDAFRYIGDRGEQRRAAAYAQLNMMSKGEQMDAELSFVSETAGAANAASEAVRSLAAKYKSPISYPRSSLASALQTVAGLIAGGINTRVYYVFQGGFDTHSGQRSRHDRLMTDLGEAVLAFQQDLASQGNAERVMTMSFSEFGRRVHENHSEGTDHGMAGPMFLFGPKVKAGLHGKHPSLKKEDLVLNRDLKFEVDFRSVYATLLEKWLGAPSKPVIGEQMALMNLLA